MLAPFQSIFDEFLLQSVAFWSEISDSCIQIIVNNKYRSNSTWNKKYYTWDIIWKGENRFDNVFQCRKKQYLSSESFVWNGDLPIHVLFSTTVTGSSLYDTSWQLTCRCSSLWLDQSAVWHSLEKCALFWHQPLKLVGEKIWDSIGTAPSDRKYVCLYLNKAR